MLIRQDRLAVKRRIVCFTTLLLVISIFLGSCASQGAVTLGNEQTRSSTNDHAATSTPVATQTTGATTAATTQIQVTSTHVFVCSEKRGAITRSFIISKELPGRLYYTIYTPPCYSKNEKYPVLYLLHGKSYQDDQWIRLGLPEVMDNNIESGTFVPFIVVMPYDPGWEDPNTGKYDRAISMELVTWIDSQYSVKKERAYRAIGGLSRGSAWAFHAGIRYPKIFSIIGIHSPAFFRDDKRKMETILADLSASSYPIRFLLDAGTLDPELNYAKRFEEFLTKNSIEHTWDNPSGTHSEAYWRENLESYLEEYSRDW